MNVKEKRIQTYLKLKKIAERGTENEQKIAFKKMEALIEKYDIDESVLMDEVIKEYEFTFKNEYTKQILIQVIHMIVGNSDDVRIYHYTHGKGCRTRLYVECTSTESLEINIAYEFYESIWDEEINSFLVAFIQKNELFPKKPPLNSESKEYTEEELLKMYRMMNSIDKKTLCKMIE